jgi:hypothetical protein
MKSESENNKTKKPNRSTCKYKWEITGYLDNLNKPVTPSNQPIYKVQRVAGVKRYFNVIYFKTYWICFVRSL